MGSPCHYVDMAAGSETIKNHASFIWSVADLLRGDYKQSEYGKVVLPLTVLRRFDCVLAPVEQEMLATYGRLKGRVENFGPVLDQPTTVAGLWNTSPYDIPKLLNVPTTSATTSTRTSPGSPLRRGRSSTGSSSPPRSPASTSRACCSKADRRAPIA